MLRHSNQTSFKKGNIPWSKVHKGQYKLGPCLDETKRKIALANTKPKIYKNCLSCRNKFSMWPSKAKTKIYCSRACQFEGQRGKPVWNKGLKSFRAGIKHDWMPKGEQHWSYKGAKVRYRALHQWVVNNLGQPSTCENCEVTELKGHQIHWANISHLYKRLLSDWIRLCAKCHKQYDMGRINIY